LLHCAALNFTMKSCLTLGLHTMSHTTAMT